MQLEGESSAKSDSSVDSDLPLTAPARQKITTSWLLLVISTVCVSFACSELLRENFPAHYATFMVCAELLFILGCMFLISWFSSLPFVGKALTNNLDTNGLGLRGDWTFFIGFWLVLPLLAIWADILTRHGLQNGG